MNAVHEGEELLIGIVAILGNVVPEEGPIFTIHHEPIEKRRKRVPSAFALIVPGGEAKELGRLLLWFEVEAIGRNMRPDSVGNEPFPKDRGACLLTDP